MPLIAIKPAWLQLIVFIVVENAVLSTVHHVCGTAKHGVAEEDTIVA